MEGGAEAGFTCRTTSCDALHAYDRKRWKPFPACSESSASADPSPPSEGDSFSAGPLLLREAGPLRRDGDVAARTRTAWFACCRRRRYVSRPASTAPSTSEPNPTDTPTTVASRCTETTSLQSWPPNPALHVHAPSAVHAPLPEQALSSGVPV